MAVLRLAGAFVTAAAATYLFAVGFYTQQSLAGFARMGAAYTPAQMRDTMLDNLLGMTAYGAVLTVALLVGFAVAALLKRVLKPLAPVAYPVAGAAAVFAAVFLIENVMASGGAGALAGGNSGLGLALQCLAGAIGGLVFALLAGRRA